MDFNEVLDFLDDAAKKTAFDHSLRKLQTTSQLDLNALNICVRLLLNSGSSQVASASEDLWSILQPCILQEGDAQRLYDIANICLSTDYLAAQIFGKMHLILEAFLAAFLGHHENTDDIQTEIDKAAGYLRFLKCSYWLSRDRYHLIGRDFVNLLSDLVGIEGLDDTALDALSALFSLLKHGGSITVASLQSPKHRNTDQSHLTESIVDQSLWERLDQFLSSNRSSNSTKAYRVWFQWISQAVRDDVELGCLLYDRFWNRVRLGLLTGFGDQRKYCLGIIKLSLRALHEDIDTSTMVYRINGGFLTAYEQYASLFEMIVLNRYTGQVEASLSELTTLLDPESKITSAMATTLLAAAIDSKVQEGIRKLVGNWYIDYVVKGDKDLSGHVDFFLGAFLTWATDGSLFNSTLRSDREETVSHHGDSLVTVIAHFVSTIEDTSSSASSTTQHVETTKTKSRSYISIILGVVRFISSAGGRIFQPAILYLLKGLVVGLKARANKHIHNTYLTRTEIAEIVGLSRLAGLPEISSDLLCVYCQQLCELLEGEISLKSMEPPGYLQLCTRTSRLQDSVDQGQPLKTQEYQLNLRAFTEELHASKHASIQGGAYAPACKSLTKFLTHVKAEAVDHTELYTALEALWDEAERREFSRPVAIHLPPLLFHPKSIQICIAQRSPNSESELSLAGLLSKALKRLQRLSHGRSYVLSVLMASVRQAVLTHPSVVYVLPCEDFLINYLDNPPTIKPEFLFEVVAAEKLQQVLPHRMYTTYYGQREWYAYAALIDILRRFPKDQLDAAKRILDRLLEPWKTQKPPVLIKSPWKDTFQLQAMLLLSDRCIEDSQADIYVDALMHALALEPWPRYRYLLEWITARLYIKFPRMTPRILEDLKGLERFSPSHIASLMKLGLLIAPYQEEAFTVDLATQLTCYSASPKVQIRHEANFAFPLVFDLAATKGWKRVTENPAFLALNNFIRGMDKFKATPWTIRTLRLDAVKDFTLVNIFQGKYLTIESPEKERVAYEDFVAIQNEDKVGAENLPPASILLGGMLPGETTMKPAAAPLVASSADPISSAIPAFLQTKAGFDLDLLHPISGPPSQQNQRPASVILIASLIDNPTNLGGLSRISESFGLKALYIDDLKKTAHKDFKATSVTSEKHFPIRQLKVAGVPDFLLAAKTEGYEVVGIEQTDRSGILGHEPDETTITEAYRKSLGTLPQQCVLVLGSEKEGIAAEVLAVIDRCVEIKTVGVTRSLNVQTAGGIAVYEWWREWGAKL